MHPSFEPTHKKANLKNMAARKPHEGVKPEVVGLLPAAGQAARIAPLPCSKELYPIGFRSVADGKSRRPKVASHYLIEKMRLAGITKVYIVLREGKWDIPTYFANGLMLDINLAYLMLSLPFGTPYTLDEAYPFVQRSVVAFGFPDIVFQPDDAFVRLLARQSQSKACAVLGLFPAEQPQKVDMVDFRNDGRVRQIVIKPRHTHLSHSWCIAVWTPVFTEFLHEYIAVHKKAATMKAEVGVGEVIQEAIKSGLEVEAMPVSDKSYLDIGTAEDLVRAIKRYGIC
jgi:glucose-1-phosphate thymidylyltransferase